MNLDGPQVHLTHVLFYHSLILQKSHNNKKPQEATKCSFSNHVPPFKHNISSIVSSPQSYQTKEYPQNRAKVDYLINGFESI